MAASVPLSRCRPEEKGTVPYAATISDSSGTAPIASAAAQASVHRQAMVSTAAATASHGTITNWRSRTRRTTRHPKGRAAFELLLNSRR